MSSQMSLFIFAICLQLCGTLRHEDKGLSEESFQDPKPRSPPYVTRNKGFSVADSQSIADVIHGCFNENITQFQDCIEKEGKEKFGWPLYAIVSDPRNSFMLAGDCQGDTSMVTTGSSNTTFGLPPLLASETWPCCGSQPQTGSPRF